MFRERVRRKLNTMQLPCWRPSVCHMFNICLMIWCFFLQTACPRWGVLRVRIKISLSKSASFQVCILDPSFLLHTSSFLRCPCGVHAICLLHLAPLRRSSFTHCVRGRRGVWGIWACLSHVLKVSKTCFVIPWLLFWCGAWAHFFAPGAVLLKPRQKRGWSLGKLFLYTKCILQAWRNSNMLAQPSRHPVQSDNSRNGAMQFDVARATVSSL